MNWVLLILIELYWKIFPPSMRRSCLFKETCSHYVYRQTREFGFFCGIKALRTRMKKCRKGYQLYTGNKGLEIKLVDGSILCEDEISPNLLRPIYGQVNIILEQQRTKSCHYKQSDSL
jgi:uncharacterized protein